MADRTVAPPSRSLVDLNRGTNDQNVEHELMMAAHTAPLTDPARLRQLEATGILQACASAKLPTLERLARLAALATRAPVGQVNLVTGDRQIPAAAFVQHGARGAGGTLLDHRDAELHGAWRAPVGLERSLCRHVVSSGAPMIVPDTRLDTRTVGTLPETEAGIGSYLAAPLLLPSGHVLGSVCVVDFAPRQWSTAEIESLAECAALASEEIAARMTAVDTLRSLGRETQSTLELLSGDDGAMAAGGDLDASANSLMAWRDLDELRRRERSLQRLQHFSSAVSIPQTVRELGEVICRVFAEAVDAPASVVSRRAIDDEQVMEFVSSSGFGVPPSPTFTRYPLEFPITSTDAIRSGEVIHACGREAIASRYPGLLAFSEAGGFDTWVAVPLRVGSDASPRAVGAVGLAFHGERQMAPAEREHLLDLGRVAAQALERVTAIERLRERERFLASVTDVVPSMLYVYNVVEHRTAWGNPAITHLLGYSLDELLAMGSEVLPTLMHPEDLVRFASHAERLAGLEDGDVAEFAYRLRCADGSWRWVESREMVFSRLPDGRVREIVGAATDIAERMQLLAAEQEARLAAEASSRAKGDFLSRMSHEFRTPLQAIQGHVQVVERGLHGPVTDGQAHALGRVQLAARHLTGLVNDVLHYAKLEAKRVEYRLTPVNVCALCPELRGMVDPQRLAKSLQWVELLPSAPCTVLADREKLVQILLNLFSNAVKFTPPHGQVIVRTLHGVPSDGWTTVEVEDTGIGIPADRLDAIFEPFVQEKVASSHESAGTGLGLTISRDLARGMGGELTVTSVQGAGSIFRLRLRTS